MKRINSLSVFSKMMLLSVISAVSVAAEAQTLKYTYNALGRVIAVEDTVNGNRDYVYDAAGNRTAVNVQSKSSSILASTSSSKSSSILASTSSSKSSSIPALLAHPKALRF